MIIVIEALVIMSLGKRLRDSVAFESNQNINVVDLRYQDSFDEISIVDMEGKEAKLTYGDNNNILFYLSASCTGCGDVLRFVERLQKVFGKDQLNVFLLWCDSIPVSLVEDYNIEIEYCYSTNQKTTLNTPTPTAYILDNQGKITYYNSDIKTSIEKMYKQAIELKNNEELLKFRANKYLMEWYGISDFKKQQVVYFCMSGCPDCEEADEILNREEGKRIIHHLYKYDDIEPSHMKDDYALFRLIYGIEWYPSFLILESEYDYRIVGEVPIETLISELDGCK